MRQPLCAWDVDGPENAELVLGLAVDIAPLLFAHRQDDAAVLGQSFEPTARGLNVRGVAAEDLVVERESLTRGAVEEKDRARWSRAVLAQLMGKGASES
ncbi:hypothetical protein HMPREF0307_01518 [Corynebacterium sp. DNF00584]|nr:hypothetical protein HMPREF0307_01518 [Corynebacterium sp. DNF00584]